MEERHNEESKKVFENLNALMGLGRGAFIDPVAVVDGVEVAFVVL